MDLLQEIKNRLCITGNFHDTLLNGLAEDVKEYLLSAGVQTAVLNSNKAVGAIARGVADLWNFGSGDGKFSEVFIQRAIQLTFEKIGQVDPSGEPAVMVPISDEELDSTLECLDTPTDSNGDQVIITEVSEDEIDEILEVLDTPSGDDGEQVIITDVSEDEIDDILECLDD